MDYRPYLDIPADPGEMNLRLAADLPGSRDLDVPALLHKLYEWTNKVRHYTEKVRPQFQRNPAAFDHSIGQFRMMCLLTVLQRDLGVAYHPKLVQGLFDARDSRTQFIHGPLTGYGGTCANLPLLYHAICWRLNYPIFVVKTAEHLFLRWDEPGQRFNVEATSRGLVVKTDE